MKAIIYPNPANNEINIQAENFISAKIYGMDGKLVLSSNESNINTSLLNNGMYIVLIQTLNGISSQQLIISK